MQEIHVATRADILAEVPELDRADLRSAGGPIAGTFLEAPPDDCPLQMTDSRLRTAMRRRLCLPHPAVDQTHNPSKPASTQCKHHTREGVFCGAALDAVGRHAGSCHTQGLPKIWHNIIRDWLVKWVGERTGYPVTPEPKVPEWNYMEGGRVVEAQLDLGFTHPTLGLVYVDVHVVSATTDQMRAEWVRDHASTDGGPGIRGVNAKRSKYPPEKHPRATLVPFVVEALGRPSEEALDFLRSLAPANPSERAIVLRKAYYELSTLLALRQAELLLSAEGGVLKAGDDARGRERDLSA